MKNKIFLDKSFSSRNQALEYICQKAEDFEIIEKNTIKSVFNSFIARENESSTGFENGFAIPHAVSNKIKQPAIIYLRINDGINWPSLDDKKTKYIIALFIPEEQRTSSHMNILSSIATGLLDKKFQDVLINSKNIEEIEFAFINRINARDSHNNEIINKGKKIIALTACPVGVAHTYIAAEKIENAAKKMGYQIKVETHGSVGVKNEFSNKEISDADLVIIASDIGGLDFSRFGGKQIYSTNLKDAIRNPEELINRAFKNAKLQAKDQLSGGTNNNSDEKKSFFVKHLLAGVSYMIPFIIFGGLLIAIALGIGNAIYGSSSAPKGTFLYYMLEAGVVAFTVMIGVLGGFIANSIAGRAAIAPAIIVSMVANSSNLLFPIAGIPVATPMGFLGAIFFGIVIGYTVKWINSWRIHKNVSAIMPIFVIPVLVTLFYSLLVIFVIGAPIGYVMDKFSGVIKSVFEDAATSSSIATRVGIGIGLGALLGAMIGFDMGGPINKIAFVLSSALLTQGIQNPMGMVAAAIPIAPIGMGIAALVYKRHFNQEQRGLGISAIIMGFVGISEGAIPFAILDPKRVFISNVVGSAVAGAIAGALGVTGAVAHGGPWMGIVGAVSGNFIGTGGTAFGLGLFFFFLAIIIGSVTTFLTYGLLLKVMKDKKVEVKQQSKLQRMFINNSLKQSFGNLSIVKIIKKDKKLFAFSVLIGLATIMLIPGIVLTAQNATGLSAAINLGVTTSWPTGTMFGFFFLGMSFVLFAASFIYSFTVFKYSTKNKQKQFV